MQVAVISAAIPLDSHISFQYKLQAKIDLNLTRGQNQRDNEVKLKEHTIKARTKDLYISNKYHTVQTMTLVSEKELKKQCYQNTKIQFEQCHLSDDCKANIKLDLQV